MTLAVAEGTGNHCYKKKELFINNICKINVVFLYFYKRVCIFRKIVCSGFYPNTMKTCIVRHKKDSILMKFMLNQGWGAGAGCFWHLGAGAGAA